MSSFVQQFMRGLAEDEGLVAAVLLLGLVVLWLPDKALALLTVVRGLWSTLRRWIAPNPPSSER